MELRATREAVSYTHLLTTPFIICIIKGQKNPMSYVIYLPYESPLELQLRGGFFID